MGILKVSPTRKHRPTAGSNKGLPHTPHLNLQQAHQFQEEHKRRNMMDSHMKQKFRGAVKAILFSNNMNSRLTARRRFRAAVKVLILSDRLCENTVGPFSRNEFVDAVHLLVALKKLEKNDAPLSHTKQLWQKAMAAVMALNNAVANDSLPGLSRERAVQEFLNQHRHKEQQKEVLAAAVELVLKALERAHEKYLPNTTACRQAAWKILEKEHKGVSREHFETTVEAIETANKYMREKTLPSSPHYRAEVMHFIEEHK